MKSHLSSLPYRKTNLISNVQPASRKKNYLQNVEQKQGHNITVPCIYPGDSCAAR